MNAKTKDFNELLKGFFEIYEKQIPFNRVLGLKLDTLSENDACIKFEMKDELVGNFIDGVLHGGVISAALDTVGALTASAGILKGMKSLEIDQILKGTIDVTTQGVVRFRVQRFTVKPDFIGIFFMFLRLGMKNGLAYQKSR